MVLQQATVCMVPQPQAVPVAVPGVQGGEPQVQAVLVSLAAGTKLMASMCTSQDPAGCVHVQGGQLC